jgi:two-component system, cell cycle response regulator CpdR
VRISLIGNTATPAPPSATMPAAPVPRGVILMSILSAMPRRGKRSFTSQMPLVLLAETVRAASTACLNASTVPTSGFGVPARTATPRPTRARSTSVPAVIRFEATSSSRPSRDRIITSAATPLASCVPIDNGLSAYQRLREEPFELLLTDIVMPEMDGIELARRAAELDPDIKIMFITGFAAVALNSDSSAPKHAKVLSKPIHLRELVNEVQKMLAA